MTRLPLVVVLLTFSSSTVAAFADHGAGDTSGGVDLDRLLADLEILRIGQIRAEPRTSPLAPSAGADVALPRDGTALLPRPDGLSAKPSPWRAPLATSDLHGFLLLPDGSLLADLTGDVRPTLALLRAPGNVALVHDDPVHAPTLGATRAADPSGAHDAGAAPALAPAPAATPAAGAPQAQTASTRTTTGPGTDAPTAAAVIAGGLSLGILGLLGLALYHRIRPAATLENDTRKAIFEAVCERPGLGVHDIAAAASVSYSTATYHLERLVAAGMLVMTPDGNKLCYYKNGGAFTESERKLIPILKNQEATRLLEAILEEPGTYRAALAERLGVTATTINWHLRRLRDAGLVDETRQGRNAYLYPRVAHLATGLRSLSAKLGPDEEPAAARLLRHVAPQGDATDAASSA